MRTEPPDIPGPMLPTEIWLPVLTRKKTNAMNNMIKITVGSSTFTATLSNNAAAAAFRALLPLTLKMEDVNGNEKFYRLSRHLPLPLQPGNRA